MMERYIAKDFDYDVLDQPFGKKVATLQLKAGTWCAMINDGDVQALFAMGVIGRHPETGQYERAFVRERPPGEEPGYTPPNEQRRPADAVAAVKKQGS